MSLNEYQATLSAKSVIFGVSIFSIFTISGYQLKDNNVLVSKCKKFLKLYFVCEPAIGILKFYLGSYFLCSSLFLLIYI